MTETLAELTLTFRITFKGPFLVSTGLAEGGFDMTGDHRLPLPATALKGVVKAQARDRLMLHRQVWQRIFGVAGRPARWEWREPLSSEVHLSPATRIKVDESGRSADQFLAFAQVMWSDPLEFNVRCRDRGVPAAEVAEDLLALRAAGRSVTALGTGRRRGLGWVQVIDLDTNGLPRPWKPADTEGLRALQSVESQ